VGYPSRCQRCPTAVYAAEARHADNVLPKVNRRRHVDAGELTLRELTDRYIARHEKVRSARTIATLRERLKRPLDEYADTKLAELEAMSEDLAEWRTTLPPRYAHKVMSALRQVLAAGVRWRMIERNPAVDAGENPGPAQRAVRA